jgi:hypothetical protein
MLNRLLVVATAAFIVSVVASQSACSRPASPPPAAAASPFTPVGTVKQIMKGIVDPTSAAIWNAVSTESGPKGVIEKAPSTDAEWAQLEHAALMLAEATNLLKMPDRQMALPDEVDAKTAPDAPELTPRQIEAKVNQDRENWGKKADALREAAVKAIAAAKAHDKDGIMNVGEAIDNACEQCHVVYWYPDEKKATPKS